MKAEQSLEDVLKQVESLSGDLSADLKEEIGHWESPPSLYNIGEEVYSKGGYYAGSSPWTKEEAENFFEDNKYWVVDKPAEPDKQKQEPARQQLQQIYDSSEWYSARYVVGKALGIEEKKLNQMIDIFISDLKIRVIAITKVGEITMELPAQGETNVNPSPETYNQVVDEVFGPDIVNRKTAAQDLSKLLKLSNSEKVKEVIKLGYEQNYNDDVGNILGEALGHSQLRTFAHGHPVFTTLSGIAAVGAASGLGYMLYQYFAR